MKSKLIIGVLLVALVTCSTIFFINVSNDHKECSNTKTISIDNNGNQIVSSTHICNEKYSF